MKKHNLIKTLSFVVLSAFVLTGCASMSYTGSDYDVNNVKKLQTQGGFYFSTYSKKSTTENVDLRIGVAQTPIQDVLVIYAELTNNNKSPYVLYQKDFKFTSSNGKAQIITAAQYINAYQSQETSAYASMQALAPTIATIATISNNFQTDGQNKVVTEQNSRSNLNAQIEKVVDGVTKFSLTNASVISAGETKYYYLFLQTNVESTISLNYKDLAYTFATK